VKSLDVTLQSSCITSKEFLFPVLDTFASALQLTCRFLHWRKTCLPCLAHRNKAVHDRGGSLRCARCVTALRQNDHFAIARQTDCFTSDWVCATPHPVEDSWQCFWLQSVLDVFWFSHFGVPFWKLERPPACLLVTCRLGLSGAGSVGIALLPLDSHFGSSRPNVKQCMVQL
jgi:hypothetical protein